MIKIKSRYYIISAVLLFTFLLGFNSIQSYANKQTVDVVLPIKQTININGGKLYTKNVTFDYYLEALDDMNPLPEGSKEKKYKFSITGNESLDLGPIQYSKEGIYEYKIYPLKTDKEDIYIHDMSEYKVTVHVKKCDKGNLIADVIGYNEDGEKKMEFDYTYSIDNSVSSDKGDAIVTGDRTDFSLLALVFISSGLLLGYNIKKKCSV